MKPHLLKAEREKRGWSLAKLAGMLGTSTRTVSRWEQGLVVPYPHYREQLCILYGKTAQELGLLSDIHEKIAEVSSTTPKLAELDASAQQTPFLVDPAIPEVLGYVGTPVGYTGTTVGLQGRQGTATESLLGRNALLALVKQRLLRRSGDTTLSLSGLPGVGKTSLAVALAMDHEVQAHFHDGILWITLGPHPNVPALLARWGKLLGVEPTEVEDATSRECWGQVLRTIIGHRKILLIIDDAWNSEDALAFRIGGTQCALLLTTRQPQVAFAFAQEGAISVPELEEYDGLTLLTHFVPQLAQQYPQEALVLVRRVGGLPLALTLMGKYLAAQAFTGQPRRLQVALAQLQDAEQRLRISMPTPLKLRPPSLPDNTPLSLYTSIAISDQQLSPQAHDTLCALSVFPSKPNSFSEEAALAVSQKSVEMLDALWDAGLLESQGPRRYMLQPTIVDYARAQAKGSEAQQHLVNYILQYLQTHKQDYWALESETNNILSALDTASKLHLEDALVQIVILSSPFMQVYGLCDQAINYLHLALKITTATENLVGRMMVLRHLASLADQRGESFQAQAYGQEGLALAQEYGQINVESDLLTILGQIAFHRGNYKEAAILYEQGLQLARQLSDDTQIIATAQYGLCRDASGPMQLAALCSDVEEARRLGMGYKEYLARFEAKEHHSLGRES